MCKFKQNHLVSFAVIGRCSEETETVHCMQCVTVEKWYSCLNNLLRDWAKQKKNQQHLSKMSLVFWTIQKKKNNHTMLKEKPIWHRYVPWSTPSSSALWFPLGSQDLSHTGQCMGSSPSCQKWSPNLLSQCILHVNSTNIESDVLLHCQSYKRVYKSRWYSLAGPKCLGSVKCVI